MSTPPALERECQAALAFPDAASFRLYERAKREQWRVDTDIDWQAFAWDELAPSIRRAMSTIYTQMQYGEMLGLVQVSRALGQLPHDWAKLFSATQVMDEARHVEFFSKVVVALGHEAPLARGLVTLGEEIAQARSAEASLLGTQIIVEGFAESVFIHGAQLARRSLASAVRLPGRQTAARFLQLLHDYVGRDEARHVAFGVLYLRQRWGELPAAARTQLQVDAERWSRMLDGLVTELSPALGGLGIPIERLRAQVARRRAAQFRQIGLEGWDADAGAALGPDSELGDQPLE